MPLIGGEMMWDSWLEYVPDPPQMDSLERSWLVDESDRHCLQSRSGLRKAEG